MILIVFVYTNVPAKFINTISGGGGKGAQTFGGGLESPLPLATGLWLAELAIKKVKKRIAVSGIPSHSYGTSLAVWDHTVLPATRHK